MLENWTWTPKELKFISSHVETGKPLLDELIEKIGASKKLNQGVRLSPSFLTAYLPSLMMLFRPSSSHSSSTSVNSSSCVFSLPSLFPPSPLMSPTQAKYDMLLHTSAHSLSADEMSRLWCSLREETSLVSIGEEIVGGQSGFAHIAGGYSAGCESPSSP
jgi:Zn-dependent oligopeptidase